LIQDLKGWKSKEDMKIVFKMEEKIQKKKEKKSRMKETKSVGTLYHNFP